MAAGWSETKVQASGDLAAALHTHLITLQKMAKFLESVSVEGQPADPSPEQIARFRALRREEAQARDMYDTAQVRYRAAFNLP